MSEPSAEQLQLIMRMHRWKTAFFGLVILLAGLIIGASGAAMYVRRSGPVEPQGIESVSEYTMASLQQELGLSPAQREQIRGIMGRRFRAIDEIRTEARPRIAREMNALYDEVSSVLDGPQRERWQDSMTRLGDDFAGRHQWGPRGGGYGGRGGGPGPGPGPQPNGRGMRRPFDHWERPGPAGGPGPGYGREGRMQGQGPRVVPENVQPPESGQDSEAPAD